MKRSQSSQAHFPGRLLAFDTSSVSLSLAVIEDGKLLADSCIMAERSHSVQLVPIIHKLMQSLDMKISDLAGFVVGVGPGSYTGVRIGVTAAKTMAWALKLPLIGVSSLEALAYGAALEKGSELGSGSGAGDLWMVPLLDARRAQVYTAVYTMGNGREMTDHNYEAFNWRCISTDGIRLLEPWLEQLTARNPQQMIFAGEVAKFAEQLRKHRFNASEMIFAEYTVHAVHTGLLGSMRLAEGERADVHRLVPNYTQMTEAEYNLAVKPLMKGC